MRWRWLAAGSDIKLSHLHVIHPLSPSSHTVPPSFTLHHAVGAHQTLTIGTTKGQKHEGPRGETASTNNYANASKVHALKAA
jgi:hypothetical protein